MRRIIIAAREGKSILEFPVYDGSETGEKVYSTLTVIGKPIAPGAKPPDDAAAKVPELGKLTRWPVTISYFEQQSAKQEQTGEQTPVYAISFELYENGISRALVLEYTDFSIKGEMTSLELKKPKPCVRERKLVVVQRQTLHHRVAAEFRTQAIHRVLGLGRRGAVDEIGEIVARGILQMTDADADQAEPGRAHLKAQQIAAGSEDARGELGRVPECARPRADFEIGALELQRHRRAGKGIGFQPRRHFFRQLP